MKNILLTGASGFVGKQIIKALNNFNVNIVPVVRPEKRNDFKKLKKINKVIISPDIFKENENWWQNQCKGIDIIIHCAWYAETGKYLNSSKNIDCLVGSIKLAKGAVNAGVKRFIGIGTCFEYDLSKNKLSINTPLKPSSPYASAKASLFIFLSQWLPKKSVKFSWCRLFYLYGDGEDKRRLVPYIHNRLSKNKQVKLTTGNQIRDYLNITEASQIISKIALSNKVGPINVCSGKSTTVKQLAYKIADLYDKRHLLKFGAQPNNPMDPPRVVGVPNFNIKKIKHKNIQE